MAIDISGVKYAPGTYEKLRPGAAQLSEHYIHEWELRQLRKKIKMPEPEMPPTICFSRKIGAGTLEIADILAEEIGYRVIDREILEYIVSEGRLSREAVALFDESYPGKMGEFLSMLVDKKAFIESDYARRLVKTIILVANFEHTIFVGRGTHLVLPRERVLAVRFVCSREYRMKRLARVLNVPEGDVDKKLDELDKDQIAFFINVYGKRNALAYEFDMMIALDYISKPKSAANIVAQAFKEKFGAEAVYSNHSLR
jgi:hypothetical protein